MEREVNNYLFLAKSDGFYLDLNTVDLQIVVATRLNSIVFGFVNT